MEINPAELPLKEAYKLITGTVVPRPIAWVSTINAEGRPNLAPFSYFNAVCTRPPTLLFCPGTRSTDVAVKDTLNNVRATGQFVVNVVTEELAEVMNVTATELPAEVNEFERAGLKTAPSKTVKPPRVAESPVNFECEVSQIVDIGDGGKGSGSIIIGTILHMHVADEVMLPGYKINTAALKPVGRLAGPNYAAIKETFELFRAPTEVTPK